MHVSNKFTQPFPLIKVARVPARYSLELYLKEFEQIL